MCQIGSSDRNHKKSAWCVLTTKTTHGEHYAFPRWNLFGWTSNWLPMTKSWIFFVCTSHVRLSAKFVSIKTNVSHSVSLTFCCEKREMKIYPWAEGHRIVCRKVTQNLVVDSTERGLYKLSCGPTMPLNAECGIFSDASQRETGSSLVQRQCFFTETCCFDFGQCAIIQQSQSFSCLIVLFPNAASLLMRRSKHLSSGQENIRIRATFHGPFSP